MVVGGPQHVYGCAQKSSSGGMGGVQGPTTPTHSAPSTHPFIHRRCRRHRRQVRRHVCVVFSDASICLSSSCPSPSPSSCSCHSSLNMFYCVSISVSLSQGHAGSSSISTYF